MTEVVTLAKPLRIRERGLDEFWLQDQICTTPSCLGLGDLEVVAKERRQSAGGRLDILLKAPEDDSMYEVEVMLGETDESHIIRSIEYWDNEKRRWPKRQHTAVLVAESITQRFFNVIQLLSHAVPIVAIQANLLEADGRAVLHFVKVLDTYEEPEEGDPSDYEQHDEAYWRQRAAWVLDVAKALQEALSPVFSDLTLRYLKYYIALGPGQKNAFWLHKRAGGKVLVNFWIPADLIPEVTPLLDEHGIPYTKRTEKLSLAMDTASVEGKAEVFRRIGIVVKKAWDR